MPSHAMAPFNSEFVRRRFADGRADDRRSEAARGTEASRTEDPGMGERRGERRRVVVFGEE